MVEGSGRCRRLTRPSACNNCRGGRSRSLGRGPNSTFYLTLPAATLTLRSSFPGAILPSSVACSVCAPNLDIPRCLPWFSRSLFLAAKNYCLHHRRGKSRLTSDHLHKLHKLHKLLTELVMSELLRCHLPATSSTPPASCPPQPALPPYVPLDDDLASSEKS